MCNRTVWLVGWFIGAALIGCSGKASRVSTPHVDPEDAADQAITAFDRDSDSQLNADELKASPPLAEALPSYDSDHNGSLTREEIAAGIGRWERRGVGAIALQFTVQLDGRPLDGAMIKLIPAPFLGDAVKPAHGVADRLGSGSLDMSDEDRPANIPKSLAAVQPGLFSVEITHPTRKVPAKFNNATTLGLETCVASQNPAGVVWSLSSK